MRCAGRRREVRLSRRPGSAGPGGALPGCPRARARMEPATPWGRHHAWACTGSTEREEPGRIRAWEVSGEGRHVPGGMTVQGSKTGLRVDACRWEPWACRARGVHACVRRDIPALGMCRIIILPPPRLRWGALGALPTIPPSCFKEGR